MLTTRKSYNEDDEDARSEAAKQPLIEIIPFDEKPEKINSTIELSTETYNQKSTKKEKKQKSKIINEMDQSEPSNVSIQK